MKTQAQSDSRNYSISPDIRSISSKSPDKANKIIRSTEKVLKTSFHEIN